VAAIFGIFVMAWVYIILNQPFERTSNLLKGNFTGTQYEPTYNKIQTIWVFFPLIFLVFYFAWGILAAMRKKNEFG